VSPFPPAARREATKETDLRHRYANTSAQQQPQRDIDRQQQQSSGSGDHQPPRPMPIARAPQLGGTDTQGRTLRLVSHVQAG
jgi:hypothetical protein